MDFMIKMIQCIGDFWTINFFNALDFAPCNFTYELTFWKLSSHLAV